MKNIFNIYIGEGGSICNGNGRMNKYAILTLFGRNYHFTLWTWKVGNGDDGSRSL